jgi:hypothetical protein
MLCGSIEIIGLPTGEVQKKVGEIDKLFNGMPWQGEYEIVVVTSTVYSVGRQTGRPFLRLMSTQTEYLGAIIDELKKLGMKIQVMLLDRIIPENG